MAIDPSIAMGLQPMKIDSPMNAMAQMMQIKHMQQQGQLGDLTMQDHQRTFDDTNKLNQLYSGALGADGTIDRAALYKNVAAGGLGSKIPSLQKGFLETDRATGEVDAQKFKLASERHAIYQKSLGALAQEPGLSKDMVVQAGQSLVQQGILPVELMQKSMMDLPDDPVQLRARLTQGMKSQLTPEQIFTVFAPKPEKIDNGGQIRFLDTNPNSPTYGKATGGAAVPKVQSPDNMATVGATIRGQNLLDARSRDTLEAGRNQVVQTDNGPVLVNTRTGAGKVVNGPDGQPLPGVTKPLNDGQSKALLFGSRMRDADKVLATLSGEGTVNSTAGSRAPYVGGAINALSSDNNQMLNQAKTDFMTAVLRRESGAAISTGEFDTANKQYFPQIGDEPGVIAQKARNRQLAIRGILLEVPEKQRGSLQSGAPAASSKVVNFGDLK